MTEKDLEDFIFAVPWAVFRFAPQYIRRQVTVPHGRIDLLVWLDWLGDGIRQHVLGVIELKLNWAKESDVIQILRYVSDVRSLTNSWYGSKVAPKYSHLPDKYWGTLESYLDVYRPGRGFGVIRPVLIASGFSQNILAACKVADINCVQWRSTQNGFAFKSVTEEETSPDVTSAREWLSPLWQVMTASASLEHSDALPCL